ncbi:hypothetical protein BDW62DRAFT_208284 [Aspergillus aurantiobrunneus]
MAQNSISCDSAIRPRRARVERGRRSRNGCSTCLSRKVKCDETRPHCGRCVRLNLTCEWPLPKPSLASRRRGFGPIKSRDSGLWSPSFIVPKDGDVFMLNQSNDSLMPITQNCMPSPGVDGLAQPEEGLTESPKSDGCLPVDETSLMSIVPLRDDVSQWVCSAADSNPAETSFASMGQMPGNNEGCLDSLLDTNFDALGLLPVPMMDPLFTTTDLSFAYATGAAPALGSDDKKAVLFHCKVFAPLKSTRDWSCSAHTLFMNKAYNRNMAFHFLLAVSHSELAIHYGQGPQPPQESREHFERGSQLFLQAHNPFASPDHVSTMLSFLYIYMFWMRRDHLDPMKLRDLSRAVLAYIRTYGLDTLCASDDVLSEGSDGVITVSEQVLLARIIAYLYDRDGFCCFFGCGGYFANYMNSISQKRQRIWLRSRAAFFLPLNDAGYANVAGSEVEDAATLDVYFELIILHQEINSYSQSSKIDDMSMKSKLQRRLKAIRKDHAVLFHRVADQTYHSECTLMTFVTITCFYALQIYFYRARQSLFGTRPIPSEFQDALNSLVSAAYYAVITGPVQLLERFQWSLLMAGLEITDPIHQEWIGNNLSDPAIKKGFDYIQAMNRQSPGGITMQKIRSLINEGFAVS